MHGRGEVLLILKMKTVEPGFTAYIYTKKSYVSNSEEKGVDLL